MVSLLYHPSYTLHPPFLLKKNSTPIIPYIQIKSHPLFYITPIINSTNLYIIHNYLLPNTHTLQHTTLLENWSGIYFSKIWLLFLVKPGCPSASEITWVIYHYFVFKWLLLLLPYVLRTCCHQQIYAPTPGWVFLLYLCLYDAPYSPYTNTTSPRYLHIYNLDVTYLMDFWNRTYP